jgi:hypothetical protein
LIYRLATPADIEPIREKYGAVWEFSLPAFVADDGQIRGILGCHLENGLFLAGPFHADTGIIAYRLVGHFEDHLRAKGLVQYIFSVKKTNPWLKIVQRANTEKIGENDDLIWFRRNLCHKAVTHRVSPQKKGN